MHSIAVIAKDIFQRNKFPEPKKDFCIYMTPEFYHVAMSEPEDNNPVQHEFLNHGTIMGHPIQITRPVRAGMPNHPKFRIVEINDVP